MITESQKYRANLFQILGLILMTPFGILVSKFFNIELIPINFHSISALLISLFLLYLGIIVILRGLEIIEGIG